jgi:hypothetical protein
MHLPSALAICIFTPVMRAACARAFDQPQRDFSEKLRIRRAVAATRLSLKNERNWDKYIISQNLVRDRPIATASTPGLARTITDAQDAPGRAQGAPGRLKCRSLPTAGNTRGGEADIARGVRAT